MPKKINTVQVMNSPRSRSIKRNRAAGNNFSMTNSSGLMSYQGGKSNKVSKSAVGTRDLFKKY